MRDRGPDSQPSSAGDPRRVLFVADDLANGGMERQLVLLATALAASRDVRVVSLTDGVYAGILRDAKIETTILPRRFRLDITPAIPLGRIIGEWRPSVVNTYGWMSAAAALLPCRVRGIPLVDTSIRTGAVVTRGDRRVRAMASRADVAIANSQAGLDAYGIGRARGRVVHNGFDPGRWALCQGGHPSGERTTVVMTARMHPHKDYRCLLDAARVLAAEEPDHWRFLAVGSGDERSALQSEYRDLIESGVAEFPEAGTEVLSLVRDADIGVLLTDPEFALEGISNSIMEYMACGLPVVCTASGGNLEIVVDGTTGFFVPPRDVRAVVEKLRLLGREPETAHRMGQAGKDRIAEQFTVEALVAGTLEAYALALALRHPGARSGD